MSKKHQWVIDYLCAVATPERLRRYRAGQPFTVKVTVDPSYHPVVCNICECAYTPERVHETCPEHPDYGGPALLDGREEKGDE